MIFYFDKKTFEDIDYYVFIYSENYLAMQFIILLSPFGHFLVMPESENGLFVEQLEFRLKMTRLEFRLYH